MNEQQYAVEARFYDALYASGGRDVRAEVGCVDAVLSDLGIEPRSLLDVACGTGVHLEVWADRGLEASWVEDHGFGERRGLLVGRPGGAT